MTIRDALLAEKQRLQIELASVDARLQTAESDIGTWLDKEEGEAKAWAVKLAGYFPWLHVLDTETNTVIPTPAPDAPIGISPTE